MNEIYLYKLLKINKYKFTRQQYLTIKGQIKKGDLIGAYKGIKK
jgi:hypothetical protein